LDGLLGILESLVTQVGIAEEAYGKGLDPPVQLVQMVAAPGLAREDARVAEVHLSATAAAVKVEPADGLVTQGIVAV
jgi:hypothetical protein